MDFFTNKFPIRYEGSPASTDSKNFLPVGTVFTVFSVCYGNTVELKSVKKTDNPIIIGVSVDMLEFAFTRTDSIE